MAKATEVVRLLLGFTAPWLWVLGDRTASGSKEVTAQMAAKWPDTPLLLEASEFVARESSENFWYFLDTVKELAIYKQTESDYSYYNLILKKAGQFLDNLQINLLKFALSIRAHSPTIEMFQQFAADEPPPHGCEAFVAIHGNHTCKISALKKLLKKATSRPRAYLYNVDHIFPVKKKDSPVVILYAEVGTRAFAKFHTVLSEKAQNGEIVYILRHYIQKPSFQKMYLSDYGVELVIKSTEYEALDDSQVQTATNMTVEDETEIDEVQGFLFGKLKELYSDLQDNLTAFQKYLIKSKKEMAPLEVWELQDLSFQAASQILSTPVYDALKLMKEISQNFPIKARSLTRITVNQQMKEEIQENQEDLAEKFAIYPGDAHLFINGLEMHDYDTFIILDLLRLEGQLMSGLVNLGINKDDINRFLKLESPVRDHSFVVDIRHPAIQWINDLESDLTYATWPESCQALLQQMSYQDIPRVRRNFHNLVLFIDPAEEYTLDFIGIAGLFLFKMVPIRIGLVFIVNTDDEVDGADDAGVALWRAFNYIREEHNVLEAFLSTILMYREMKQNIITVEGIKRFFQKKYPHVYIWDILGTHSKYDYERKAGARFYEITGLGPLPQALYNGESFNHEELSFGQLIKSVHSKMLKTGRQLQNDVTMGTINDHTKAIDFLMDKNNGVPRINSSILYTKGQYLNLISTSVTADVEDFSTFSFLDSQDKSAVIAKNMHYLTQEGDSIISPVTFWIIADFDKPSGRKLLFNALVHMKTSVHSRLGVIYNPTSKINEENTAISRGILAAFLTQKNSFLNDFLRKLSKEETATAIYSGNKIKTFLTQGMDKNAFEKKYNTIGMNLFRTHQLFCQHVLKLDPGEMAVVTNGRFIDSLDENIYAEDFYLLEKLAFSESAEKIKGIVENMEINSTNIIKIEPQENDVFFDVIAIVDPLTREAAKMAQLLIVLGKVVNMRLRLFMNCQGMLTEAPLRSFYRFVLEPELMFRSNDVLHPVAKFVGIPESPLFTLNVIVPDGWLAETVHSNCDLDNIRLKDIERMVVAEYELEYLLLEGNCFDEAGDLPVPGLQFTLGTKRKPVVVDTIAITSSGYFQLKANPGAWILMLQQGTSEDTYEIVGQRGADSDPDLGEVIVVLDSFQRTCLRLQVQRMPDKEEESSLTDEEKKQGARGSIQSFARRLHGKKDKQETDVLNIFSVASGYLHEHFLRVMMLSVLRNTKTPVKFWLLKDYLSPTFKEGLPHMAEVYEFQYELVQYRWPRWLHEETERQTILRAYKILLLDVLFPLTVDKIIVVDADQIVRHDLKELRDLDLDGAPYGYVPFCDGRAEMDGHRFWKTEKWATHLERRKYHISDLFIVDLKEFRRIIVGDRFRDMYHNLKSNPDAAFGKFDLPQALPNILISSIALKTLPQDWLWCETWCDDDSKHRAKIISLCDNPQTKEPKLKAAARIIPEWVEYDTEIRQLLAHLGQKESDVLTHDEL